MSIILMTTQFYKALITRRNLMLSLLGLKKLTGLTYAPINSKLQLNILTENYFEKV